MSIAQSVLEGLMGIGWSITYVALIYRGFQDKSYGMPLLPLALNVAWEFVFAFLHPPGATMDHVIIVVWFVLDVFVLATFLQNSSKYFELHYRIGTFEWLFITFLAFLGSFFMIILGGSYFYDFPVFSADPYGEYNSFLAFITNSVMSVNFVCMFYSRRFFHTTKTILDYEGLDGNSITEKNPTLLKYSAPIGSEIQSYDGQSFTIAYCKFIGTFSAALSYIIGDQPDNWYFIGVFVATSFIFDIWYMILIYSELSKAKINPWKRF